MLEPEVQDASQPDENAVKKHKKDKKHKKEKKHKRGKEKHQHRSPTAQVVEGSEGTAVQHLQPATEEADVAFPAAEVAKDAAEARPAKRPRSADSAPESGEIAGQTEPGEEVQKGKQQENGSAPVPEGNVSKKHSADDRPDGEGSRKRRKSEHSPGGGKEALDSKAATEGLAARADGGKRSSAAEGTEAHRSDREEGRSHRPSSRPRDDSRRSRDEPALRHPSRARDDSRSHRDDRRQGSPSGGGHRHQSRPRSRARSREPAARSPRDRRERGHGEPPRRSDSVRRRDGEADRDCDRRRVSDGRDRPRWEDSRDRRRADSRGRRREDSRERRDRGGGRKDERRRSRSREKEDKDFAARVIAKLEENEVDEDELIEQRRRKRQELLMKLQQEQQAASAVANPTAAEIATQKSGTTQEELPSSEASAAPELATAGPVTAAAAAAPSEAQTSSAGPAEAPTSTAAPAEAAADADKPPALAGVSQLAPLMQQQNGAVSTPVSPSASLPRPESSAQMQKDDRLADSDTEEEHGLDEGTEEQLFQSRKDGQAPEAHESAPPTPSASEERHKIQNQEKKRLAGEVDIFSTEIVEDMFADEPVAAPAAAGHNAPKRGLLDNYDDSEGYYNFQVGEVMNDRYEVFATHGKGVFSTVLRARDLKPIDEKGKPLPVVGGAYPEVAIKVIRANDIMSKAGQTEVVILRKLAGADPGNKYHIIRLIGTFEYRHHLCLVFEPLESNLRQLTKKYGQGIGLRLDAVRSMAAQMLMALHLMKQCGVLHADIKPDNILINRGHNVVKMCDFGSAMFTGNNELTPYLVSRFYRAPEIILGLHYDHPMDVWSIGCVIYELFTGRILFPGRTNNEMLKLMMDAKGPFPKKMLKKGEFTPQHFEDDPAMSFCLLEIDALTKLPAKRLIPNPTIKKDFKALLAGQEGEPRQVANLVDLLERMLALDPEKRITAKEALRHPFIKDGRAAPQRPQK